MKTDIAVPTTDLTIPGPDGALRARHYRPAVAGAPSVNLATRRAEASSDSRSAAVWCRNYMPVTALVIASPMPAKMPPNWVPLNGNWVTDPSEPKSVSVTG